MDKNAKPLPKSAVDNVPKQLGSADAQRASGPLQSFLDFAETNGTQHDKSSGASLRSEVRSLQKEISDLKEATKGAITELQRLKTADRVLADMHARCKELGERFHEREVLNPTFRGLILIADRCRQDVRRISGTLVRIRETRNHRAVSALRHLLAARNADQVEIENLLAHYGVETYEHPQGKFDPSVQKCVSRIEGLNGAMAGHIAERLLPGYQRNGSVIRAEYVSVYVRDEPGTEKGERK